MADLNIAQKLDARVKVLFTLAFILSLSLAPMGAWAVYVLMLSLIISIVIIDRQPFKPLLLRSLVSLVFVISAAPLIFTGAEPLRAVSFGGWQVNISPAGVERFISIFCKAWISILAAIWLSLSVGVPELLLAFKRLRLPRVFLAILTLMWRYLFVLRTEAAALLHARSARSGRSANPALRRGGSVFWRAQVTGNMAGNLLLRSLERADRVYAAMLARGYTGEITDPAPRPLTLREITMLTAGLVLLLFIVFFSFWLKA